MKLNFFQSAKSIEEQLFQAAKSVNWLGELDISPEAFKQLGQVVYDIGNGRKPPDPDHVPPLMLVTSMVFMARYAEFGDDESPSFWHPYLATVWQNDREDVKFQTECREAFRKARSRLEDELGLYFPHKATHEQDVVSGIYMHAVLPSYLEDDFARWLAALWEKGVTWARDADMPLEERIVAMRYHRLENLPKRLRYFIEKDETRETAARLIETLAIAAQEVANGTPFDDVGGMLSPIERAIWQHLRPSLDGQSWRPADKTKAKGSLMRMRWAWHVGRNSLGLLVQNWRSKSSVPPDRLVWAETEDDLAHYKHYANLQPWQRDDGWWIDQASLEGIGNGGWLGLVDEDDQLLSKSLPVPPLAQDEVLFFEQDLDSGWAVQVRRDRLSEGSIIIASTQRFDLAHPHNDDPIAPQRVLALPDMLSQLGYQYAALYDLRLPATLVYANDRMPLRTRNIRLKAVLEGPRLAQLSDSDGGVFGKAPRLRLRGAAELRASLGQIRLRLEGAQHGLAQHVFNAERLQRDGDDLLLPLDDLNLPPDLYRLTLSHDAHRVTIDSLDFALLPPDWDIQAPQNPKGFTIGQPPEVVLRGPAAETLRLPKDASLISEGTAVRVRWTQPGSPAHLLIQWGSALLPLEWPIIWRHACVDPPRTHADLDDLKTMRLLLQGLPKQEMTLHAGDAARIVQLQANGSYESVIANDPLRDMLVDQPDAFIDVWVSDGEARWPLFTFVRQEEEAVLALPNLARRAFTLARALPKNWAYHRRVWYKPERLLALPTPQLAHFQAALAGPYQPILETMQSIPHLPLAKLTPWAVPPSAKAVLQLEGVANRLDVRVDALPPWGGQGHMDDGKPKLSLSWHSYTDSHARVQLSARDTWYVCAVCGTLFDESKKLYHGHQRGWSITHTPLNGEFVGVFHWTSDDLPANWQADFSVALDRDKIRRYLVRKEQASRCQPAPFYAADGYRYAVAEWSLAMNDKDKREQLKSLLNSSLVEHGLQLRTKLTVDQVNQGAPALRWLKPFFAALDVEGDEWKRLDLALAALALNVRGQAHSLRLPFTWHWLDDEALYQALQTSMSACPHLLAWAFGWMELILWTVSAAADPLSPRES